MRCAASTGTRTTVKSGGHSYGAYGLAGALVIDLLEFQTVAVDAATKVATVGGGVRLGNMAARIYAQGQRGCVLPRPLRRRR